MEYTDDYRVRWGKPIVWDEISYEYNIDIGWGNIFGQEFIRRFWEVSLRGGYGLKRSPSSFEETVGVPVGMDLFESDGPGYEIHYYGFGRSDFRHFFKSPDEVWKVEIIDTWMMTVTDIGAYSGRFRVQLPGKEYIAARLVRVAEKNT